MTGPTTGSPALPAGDHEGSEGSDGQRGRRRERVERNIYQRVAATGTVAFEVGYRDSAGKQRWQTVDGGITAARAARDDVLGRKGRGEQVRPNPGLRFGEAAMPGSPGR